MTASHIETLLTIVELERDAYGSALYQIAAYVGLDTRDLDEPLPFADAVVAAVEAWASSSRSEAARIPCPDE